MRVAQVVLHIISRTRSRFTIIRKKLKDPVTDEKPKKTAKKLGQKEPKVPKDSLFTEKATNDRFRIPYACGNHQSPCTQTRSAQAQAPLGVQER